MPVALIVVVVVLLDQITKYAIISRYQLGGGTPVISGFFDLRYIRNTGAAWGIFAGYSSMLVLLSFVMLGVIFFYRKQFLYDSPLHKVAGALMTGGIIGNLVDRMKWGYVIDFLDFYFRKSHFPAFNVADSAICTGVGLYILSQFLQARRDRKREAAEGK